MSLMASVTCSIFFIRNGGELDTWMKVWNAGGLILGLVIRYNYGAGDMSRVKI